MQLTVNLCLPDGITDAPQARDDEESGRRLSAGPPDEEPDDQPQVQGRPHDQDGEPSDVLHGRTEEKGAERVHDAEADHHVPDRSYAKRARYVGLEK